MSVQMNQYLMYGVLIDPDKCDEDFYDTYESFMDDSAYKSFVNEKDGIFCVYDGMSGKFCVVGKVIEKSADESYIGGRTPIKIDSLSSKQKAVIKASIQRNFADLLDKDYDVSYYFVTQYR